MTVKFPTYEEMGKKVAEKALDEILYDGKSIREWAKIIASEDAVSRDEAIVQLSHLLSDWDDDWNVAIRKCIETLKIVKPVTPQPKIGQWIDIMVGDMPAQACDQCNTFYPLAYTGGGHNYCPNCGAKMGGEK